MAPCFDSFSPVFRFGPSDGTDQSRSGPVGDHISHTQHNTDTDHHTGHHRYQNVVIEEHDPFAGFEEAIKNSEVIRIRKVNIKIKPSQNKQKKENLYL